MRSLHIASRISSLARIDTSSKNNRKVFKQACERYDLVYFGTVSQRDDEHQMVRGFTLSPSHLDKFYCVGTVSGRDVILLERTDTVSYPDKPSKSYSWTIIQIDLKKNIPTHIILNSHHYDETLYKNLMLKNRHLSRVDAYSLPIAHERFMSVFRVYGPLQHLNELQRILTPERTSVLGHHFSQFDYEFYHDQLIVMSLTDAPSLHMIQNMFHAGLWLADELEK